MILYLYHNTCIIIIIIVEDLYHAYFRRDLIIFQNFDYFRSVDLFLLYSLVFTGILALPSINLPSWFFVVLSVFWTAVVKFGLGVILSLQSRHKFWVKHFIKHGGSNREAFSNWKSVYNFSLTMSYFSLTLAALKLYSPPESLFDLLSGNIILRHVFGILLILIHAWMSFSVFGVLGDFGWYCALLLYTLL